MQRQIIRRLRNALYFVMMLALLVNAMQPVLALAAPRGVEYSAPVALSGNVAQSSALAAAQTVVNCDLYPIALHTSSIAGIQPGDNIGDIYNGTAPGNFGWLSWTGDPSETALATSLTPPGDSSTYVDPNNPNNHTLSVGDWVDGRPGVSNSQAIRNALTQLESQDITVPVWDESQGNGSTSQYHIVGFALVFITSFQLPGQNRISARYDGSTPCGTPPPPPPGPSLSGDTLTLSPSVAGPDVAGTTQTLTATLKNRTGSPVEGIDIQFTVTGANPGSGGGTTDANGQTTLTYQGTNQGSDTIQASATSGGTTVQSNTASVSWVAPIQKVSTTTVWGRFFPNPSNCQCVTAQPSQTPVFTEAFPTINFNPPAGTILNNTSNVGSGNRPMVDVTTDVNGSYTGTIVAQGYSPQGTLEQAGVNDLVTFDAVFTGTYTVAAAGQVTYTFYTDDGAYLGIGNGATYVGGSKNNTPAMTPFEGFPVVGGNNSCCSATFTVNFPAAGTYPYEVDYSECCGDGLSLAMTTTSSTGGTTGVAPTGALSLSPTIVPSQAAGGTQTLTVKAADAAGNALPNLPVSLTIIGPNAQRLQATTDSTGTATITYTGTYAGTDTAQAFAWIGGQPTYSGQVSVTWTPSSTPPPTPQTQTPGWIGSPSPQSTVTGVVPITLGANITLSTGTVAYWPASDPQAVTTLASGVTGVGGATLATLDTTTLPNGTYVIQLLGTDNNGNQLNSETLVTVAGQNKPGRVTFSVTDLTVPVTGLPITIGRTYDSLNKGQSGDFGNGWALSVGSPKLTTDPAHNVTLTMPDGRRVTFAFTPQSTGGIFGFLLTPAYTPEPGVHGSLTSDGCGLLAASGGQLFCFPGGQYTPTTYTYTDPYGRVYVMGADGSLKSITDLNGNTLTFSASGITSSAGNATVAFTRDSAGRITQITDPAGNVYSYGYDASGNLTNVTFPGVATPASYTYDSTHLLLTAKDPRGNTGVTTTYDTNGRLASVTDALQNTTTYSYDLSANTTTVTAPDGGKTVYTYDSFGDLVSQTDPLGHTTTAAYDSNRNLTSVTDALGNKTSFTYDSQGNVTSVTDPLGKTRSVAYNPFGGPTALTDPLGNTTTVSYNASALVSSLSDSIGPLATFTWDSQGNPLTRTDGNGQPTAYTYDAFGHVLSQADPLGDTTHATYDAFGHMLTSTDARGNVTKYTYDALGHLLTSTDPLGNVTTYTYDADGNQITMKDALGRTTTYTYDATNRLIQTTYPDGTFTKTTYDFRGNVLSETDQAGHVTQNTYDLAGELTSITAAAGTPDAATTSYTYDADGHQLTVKDPRGNVTTYGYDVDGRLTSVKDALGHTASYTYDADGRRASIIDANTHTTTYTYDARGRLVKTTYPDGTTTQQSYDGAGDRLTVTDQAGSATTYGYDNARRLTSMTDAIQPTPNVTQYTYDPNGNLTSVIDANNHTTSYTYDADNRLAKKTLPDGSFEQMTYDAVGNQISQRLADGHTDTYTYDALDRLTKLSYFDSTSVSYTYTTTGQRATVVDGRGTTTYTYDNQDRLIQISVPDGQTISYTYDAAGNRTGMTTAAGLTAYTYDADNRLATVAAPSVGTISFGYDNAGNPTTRTLPNGITVNYGYDSLNRLTSVAETAGANTLASYTYTLGPAGNRTKVTEADGTTVAWSYDADYRLTGETLTAPGGTVQAQATYAYDGVGNRTSLSSGGTTTTYSYNSLDQLISASTPSQSASYTYDGRGNLTSVATTGGSGGTNTTSYSYNAADQMTGVTLPNGTAASYAYDASGRQVSQTTGGVTTNYLWDEASPYGDIALETDGSGTVQASYTLGGTALLAQTRGGSVSYVLPDGQGSVRQLANSVGEITDTYRYDAYGNVLSHSGSTVLPYGYDGQRLDSTSGLYQLRARNYDPTTGRFTTPDTAALSPTDVMQLDRYVYAGANPINMSDPSGHNFLAYALETAVSVGEAYFAAVDLSEALALLFTEGAIDEAAAAAGVSADVVWVGTVLRAVWDIYHLVTDLSTFIHVLQQIYQAFVNAFTSGLGPGGTGGGGGGTIGGGSGGGSGGGGPSGPRQSPDLALLARGLRGSICTLRDPPWSPYRIQKCLENTTVLIMDADVVGKTKPVRIVTVNMCAWVVQGDYCGFDPGQKLAETGWEVIPPDPSVGNNAHAEVLAARWLLTTGPYVGRIHVVDYGTSYPNGGACNTCVPVVATWP